MKYKQLINFDFASTDYSNDKDALANKLCLKWHPVTMPGDSIKHLRQVGIETKDPNVKDNQKEYLCYENKNFYYRTQVNIDTSSANHYILYADGLDTFCDVFVNDTLVHQHNDSFIRFSCDITAYCIHGNNELLFAFKAPVLHVKSIIKNFHENDFAAAFDEPWRVWIRKPQFHYGWDNTPHLAGAGFIGMPVLITIDENVYIKDIFFDYDYKYQEKKVFFSIKINADVYKTVDIYTIVKFNRKTVWRSGICTLDKGNLVRDEIASGMIEKVKEWQIKGYGKPNQYEIVITTKAGTLLFRSMTGIRSIELSSRIIEKRQINYEIKSPGESIIEMDGTSCADKNAAESVIGGLNAGAWSRVETTPHMVDIHEFRFIINGIPVFLKGFNWQPLESNLSNVEIDRYEKNLALYDAIGANVLRIWGGAYIEDKRLYDFCDEHGILIWQDFQFACALYPDADKEFRSAIEKEVRDIYTRLQIHPSIGIYCGSNEIDMILYDRCLDRRTRNSIGYEIIPDTLKSLGSKTPYHVTSPYGIDYPRSPFSGDGRNWTLREYIENDYPLLRKDESVFNSEGGAPAFPSIENVSYFLAGDETLHEDTLEQIYTYRLHAGSSLMWHRKEYFHGLFKNVRRHFGEWQSIDDLIYLTQLFQADALARYVEIFRYKERTCGGCMIWKYADTWPDVELSVIDYSSVPKAAYYTLQRAMRNITLCPFFDDEMITFGISSVLPRYKAELRVDVIHINGNIVSSYKEKISMNRGIYHASIKIQRESLRNNYGKGNILLRARLYKRMSIISERIYFPETMRSLHINPQAKISWYFRFLHNKNGYYHYTCTLKAQETILGVVLIPRNGLSSYCSFSNNMIHLLPGDSHSITVISSSQITQKDIIVKYYNQFVTT